MSSAIRQRLSDNLRRLIYERGINAYDIAREAGISAGFVSDVIAGKKAASLASLEKIRSAYDLDPSDLFRQTQAVGLAHQYGEKHLPSKDIRGQDARDLSLADDGRIDGPEQQLDYIARLETRLERLAFTTEELSRTNAKLERQVAELGSISDAVADRAAGFITQALDEQRRMADALQTRLSGVLSQYERKITRPTRSKR